LCFRIGISKTLVTKLQEGDISLITQQAKKMLPLEHDELLAKTISPALFAPDQYLVQQRIAVDSTSVPSAIPVGACSFLHPIRNSENGSCSHFPKR